MTDCKQKKNGHEEDNDTHHGGSNHHQSHSPERDLQPRLLQAEPDNGDGDRWRFSHPEFYYWLLHNNYKKTAAEKNKLGFRTLAGINLYNQVDDAEKIDSALTKRAEVEALNVADRQIDLAWLAESSKINGQLDKMKANIDHIIPTGGTINDKRRWEELYNMYQCAVKATKDAYMPNAQRKRQYLSIYADLTTQNETLLKYLVQLNTQSQTTALLAATNDRVVHKGSIISDAKSRWQENMKGVRSSTGTDSDDANSGEVKKV